MVFVGIFFRGPDIYRTSVVWMFREGNPYFVFFPIPLDGQDRTITLFCDKMCQGSLKFPVEQRDEKKDSIHFNLECVCAFCRKHSAFA